MEQSRGRRNIVIGQRVSDAKRERARAMRVAPTAEEELLWQRLAERAWQFSLSATAGHRRLHRRLLLPCSWARRRSRRSHPQAERVLRPRARCNRESARLAHPPLHERSSAQRSSSRPRRHPERTAQVATRERSSIQAPLPAPGRGRGLGSPRCGGGQAEPVKAGTVLAAIRSEQVVTRKRSSTQAPLPAPEGAGG